MDADEKGSAPAGAEDGEDLVFEPAPDLRAAPAIHAPREPEAPRPERGLGDARDRSSDPADPADPAHPAALPFGTFEGIDPRWAAAARLAGLVGLLGPAAALALALGLRLHRLAGLTEARALAIAAPLFAVLFAWRLILPGLAQPRWRYKVNDRVLVVEYGVIVLRSVLVPLSRIQHVDIQRGPFDRLFGIATLVLNTAGTADDDVPIPGLTPERAAALRDHLVRRSGLGDPDPGGCAEPADGL